MNKSFVKLFTAVGIVLNLYPIPSIALDQKEAFQQGIQFASTKQGTALSSLKENMPGHTVENYTDHPNETGYRESPDSIKQKANEKIHQDDNGKNILAGIDIRNEKFKFAKNPDSPLIKNILQKSDAIYDVVTGQFGDCTKKTNCTTTFKTEICEESPAVTLQYCSQKLDIVMVPKQVETKYSFTVNLEVEDHNYAGLDVNLITGKVGFLGSHDADYSLTGRLPSNIECQTLHGEIVSQTGGAKLDKFDFPSCANGLSLNMHISSGHKKNITFNVISTKIVPEPQDHWQDGCEGLSNSKNCSSKEERCIEENTTHIVDGQPVTRACWQKEKSYSCGDYDKVEACLPLRQQGCEQVASTCKNKANDTCTLYEQAFQCPIKQCTDVGMICNEETYCLDGDCINQQKKADPDFQRSVSALSAANEAAKDFTNLNSIFTGERKTCNKVFLGFIDCCADEGWGKDIHLAQCSPEEKDLAESKENLQTVYLGEYCSKDELGVCVEHRKAYCVFSSKLARIIQVQGRRDQLKIGFGDPEHADCKGLTREQFASLDLGKMNFSDFYAEIAQKQRIEDSSEISQRIDDKVHSFEKGREAHA